MQSKRTTFPFCKSLNWFFPLKFDRTIEGFHGGHVVSQGRENAASSSGPSAWDVPYKASHEEGPGDEVEKMYCFGPPTWRQWRHMKMLHCALLLSSWRGRAKTSNFVVRLKHASCQGAQWITRKEFGTFFIETQASLHISFSCIEVKS